jgi:serine/threonine protein kinase
MAKDTGPLKIGEILLNKWEIRGLLGQGGHAWVYHGYDAYLDREVAIKVIPPPPPESDPQRDMRKRAQGEARTLSKLKHDNVVHLFDGFTSDAAVYIVMEILRGRTWRDVLNIVGTLNVVEALALGAKVADGVHAAHAVNVIHRDLKPENVFVIENNGIKVLDFGIAKLFGPGAATTQRNLLHGTMKYMSPEHLLGGSVTIRSDIFALGTMMYESLYGRIPCMIGIEEPTGDSLIYAQLHRMPPMLDAIVPSVPRAMARAIHRMIAKDPKDRFETMEEVSNVLRSLEKSNGTAPAARELWRAAPPQVTASALSHATTEVHELSTLAPPTAPPVTLPTPQAQDTTPVSRPPFSEPKPHAGPHPFVQVTEPIRIVPAAPPTSPSPAHAPVAVAAPASVVEPQRALPPTMAPTIEASVPLSQAARRAPTSAPSAPQAPPSDRSRPPRAAPNSANPTSARPVRAPGRTQAAQPKSKGSWNLLSLGIALGSAVGLATGLGMYWHPQHATASTEEPVAVISAQPARPIEVPPPGNPAAPTTTQDPAAELSARTTPTPTTAPVGAAPRAAPTAPALVAPKISAAATASPAPAPHLALKPAPKPQAPTTHGGLWDMSDLDTPTQPKPAPSAASKRQNKAIYGDNPVVR